VGVFGSILGTWCVRGKDDPNMNPMKPINFGFWVAALSSVVGFWIVSYFYLGDIVSPKYGTLWWRVFLANVMGIALALVIQWLTEYFTATDKKPVTEIAYSSRTGPATLILSGFAAGLESSVWATLAIAATIFGSYSIFGGSFSLSAYGIALAGLGLLATTGFVLAEDTFGPISDNASGIFEMSGALKNAPRTPSGIEAHRIVAKLDAVGNTTKALTKGLAIATAVFGTIAIGIAMVGYLVRPMGWLQRWLLLLAGVALLIPPGGTIFYSWVLNATGAAVCLAILLAEWRNHGALQAQKTFSAEQEIAARK